MNANSLVNLLINSLSSDTNSTDSNLFLWDVLDPVFRLALLNQKQVQFDFSNIKNDTSSILWENLDSSIQNFLLNQRESLLNLTFSQWSWVKPNTKYANSNLLLFLSKQAIQNVQNLMFYLNQIEFRTLLNSTLLQENISKISPNFSNSNFTIQNYLTNFYSDLISYLAPGKNNAQYKVYQKAISKLNSFYKSLYSS